MIDLKLLQSMQWSRVHDYVIPGLTSSLIGGKGHGLVRMFSQERNHEEPITPHSHRFDFNCLVIKGRVTNRVWVESPEGDAYQLTTLRHHGEFGDQTRGTETRMGKWVPITKKYNAGDWYAMSADQIHSIFFSKGAEVLFFEGPNYSMESKTLEPVSGGRVIPIFRVDSWMFRREEE